MSNLEIVTHCWRYSRLLCYQLSSLFIAPPESTHTIITVFFSADDDDTVQVLNWFQGQLVPDTIRLDFRPLDRPQLLRRSIGRNRAALSTIADVVWFTDCDYLFGMGCIDALCGQIDGTTVLYFPRTVLVNTTHELGDAYIRRFETPAVLDVNERDFSPKTMRRAIGGIQIVPGDIARRYGYLPQSRKDQTPELGERMTDFASDVRYRKSLGMPGTAIDIPKVFRLRHSVAGRFRDVDL